MSVQQVKPLYLTEIAGLGGGETSLLNLLVAMGERGYGPLLLCPEGALYREALRLGIAATSLQFPSVRLRGGWLPTFSLRTVLDVCRIMREHGAQIVHAESLLGLYYGGLAARIRGIKCVATYHGYWRLQSSLSRWLVRYLCDGIYPVSDTVSRELGECVGDVRGRIQTIPLGFSNAFLADLPGRLEAREMLGLPRTRPIVMQVARFQPIKGQLNLLSALEELLRQRRVIDPLVVFVGGLLEPAPAESASYMREVEEKAQSRALQEHVCFMGDRRDVPLLMRAADVVVTPSDYESFSMTTVEAMAIGTPIIATAAGGPSEILEDGITGILVPARDSAALAAALERVFANPEWAAALASRAKEVSRREYSPKVRYVRLMREYAHLLGYSTTSTMAT